MNTVIWSNKAVRQLKKISHSHRGVIHQKAGVLERFPDVQGVIRLKNYKYTYRLRIGDYRIFFEYGAEIKIISIQEVKKRDERTY